MNIAINVEWSKREWVARATVTVDGAAWGSVRGRNSWAALNRLRHRAKRRIEAHANGPEAKVDGAVWSALRDRMAQERAKHSRCSSAD